VTSQDRHGDGNPSVSRDSSNISRDTEGETSQDRHGDVTKKKFQKPCVEDVALYCLEGNYLVDSAKFVAYYESNGWKVGKNPMKDWKASVRYWHSQNAPVTPPPKPVEKVKLKLNPEVYRNGN
jgi:hypothetical protein